MTNYQKNSALVFLRKTKPIDNFVNTPDGRLHYLAWGANGLQTYLAHATGFCAGTYTPLVNRLEKELCVIAGDSRGHGESQFAKQLQIVDWKVFAEDLKLIIEHSMTPPVIGIGHSLGAMTTIMAAAIYPQLFRAIVLLDPIVFQRRIILKRFFLRLLGIRGNVSLIKRTRKRRRIFKDKTEALQHYMHERGVFKTWKKEFIEAYIECGLLKNDTQQAVLACNPELEAQIFESAPLDIWTYIKKIKCPVLAIRGEFSKVFPTKSANRMQRIVSDIEIHTILNSGHFFPMEKPEQCAKLILKFIHQLQKRG